MQFPNALLTEIPLADYFVQKFVSHLEDCMVCKHFGICGGCSYQDVPYQEQLLKKQKNIEELFACLKPAEILKIIPSTEIFFYRNKMEFAFDSHSKPPAIGQRQRKNFNKPRPCAQERGKVIDLQECLIFSENTGQILDTVRRWGEGVASEFLRFLIVRESKKTKTLMLNLILRTTRYVFENKLKNKCFELAESIKKNNLTVGCFTVGFNNTKSEVATADDTLHLCGEKYIEETLCGLKFRIFPYTFFQTNTLGAEILYKSAINLINSVPSSTCIDIYCGSGALGLIASSLFEKVLGVESNPLSIENAQLNAEINNISNCEFVSERAEVFLNKLTSSKFAVKLNTVLIDPPRPGVANKALKAIIDLNPQEIIYLSCKSTSMLDDLSKLIPVYKIEKIQPVDMFPHTPHTELIAYLTHR